MTPNYAQFVKHPKTRPSTPIIEILPPHDQWTLIWVEKGCHRWITLIQWMMIHSFADTKPCCQRMFSFTTHFLSAKTYWDHGDPRGPIRTEDGGRPAKASTRERSPRRTHRAGTSGAGATLRCQL